MDTGEVTVIADNYNGSKLNSPNELIIWPGDYDSIYFSDPPYAISENENVS